MYAQAAVTDPVLYVGLYSTGDAPSEVDDYHWVFIVGPSHEEAGSQGTLYSMEPRHHTKWYWSYSQSIVPLQDLSALLVRLMVAEVVDTNMLQMTMLRWAEEVSMRLQVEWMSVRWAQRVLKSLEDEGCLGKKMKSFESVEAEGRRLAGMEEKKRNVDIAIRSPVLYAAVHPNYRPPCEDDESHWAFLSGPVSKTAESERAGHVVDMQLDSRGRPIWGYGQTAIPLPDADDLRVRMLIADISKLGLLGEMVCDHNVTPTFDRTTFAGNSKSRTFLRIQEKIEVLEGQPDCFAFEFRKSSMCEEVLVDEVTSNQPGAKPWWPSRPGGKTFCLLRASKMPDHDEAQIVVNLDLSRPEPITMSVAIEIVTSALGAAAKALRHQNAAREQREKKSEQKCEPIAKPREIAIRNSWFVEVQRLDQEKILAENEAETERAPTWFNVAAKAGEGEHGRGEDEGGEEEGKDEEEKGDDEKAADDEEEEEEEKEEDAEEADDDDEAEADNDNDDDEEEDDEGEDRRDEEDVDSGDRKEVNDMLEEEAGEKPPTLRPALVRSKTKAAIESDEDEDNDEDDEDDEDEDEDGDGDGKDSSEEDEENDEEDDEDDDEDDNKNKEYSSSDDEDDDEDDSSEDDDDDSENGHE